MTASARAAPAITLESLGKRYLVMQDRGMLLRSLLPFRRPVRREHWALRDVDLRVEKGETVGVLGRNGAGKTTLLRLLAGVTRPSAGSVEIRGRVAPLIGVGVGFHPEMSGRENVYVNGMLLGLSHAEVTERFDAIVDFAELEDFIDTPVKFYSSGMFMRLGFSVAVHVDPQVLLVDEVLAVGDIAFQLKCFERIRHMQTTGMTVIIVSHSMHAIRLLCPRALVFRHGSLVHDGDPDGAIALHHRILAEEGHGTGVPIDAQLVTGAVTLVHRSLRRDRAAEATTLEPGERCTASYRFRAERDVDSPQILFSVVAEDGTVAYQRHSAIGERHRAVAAGEEFTVDIPFLVRLGGGGSFQIRLDVTDLSHREVLGRDDEGLAFYVPPVLGVAGLTDLEAQIRFDGTPIDEHTDLTLGGATES